MTETCTTAGALKRLSDEGASVRLDGLSPGGYARARARLAAVEQLGISSDDARQVEERGSTTFEAAWQDLLGAVAESLDNKGVDPR
ncbi:MULTISPECIES: hypothetical protein [Streptomyces]|uniref:hypothetical protein n=1 Tax=Streptomyces TaxID=1883 RepID=UPI00131AA383|nr:hypothetical protein [Streptomyces sp. MUM 16J]